MKLRNPRQIRVVAFVAAVLVRVWMATIRMRVVNRDVVEHPADAAHERFIYAFWHESLLAPVKFRARVRVLISKHADGELIARVCHHLGFGVVRGSTNRGGGEALMKLRDCSRASHLVFTPDGPRGPRRRVQLGVVVIAGSTGLPVVPVGIGFSGAWRAGSWDCFAVPKPFSRCICIAGKAVRVPPGLDRDGIERYRLLVEESLAEATEAAERLARGGRVGPHFADGLKPASPVDTGTLA